MSFSWDQLDIHGYQDLTLLENHVENVYNFPSLTDLKYYALEEGRTFLQSSLNKDR